MAPATANGFVSAVLLCVLFATSGWPDSVEPFVEGVRVVRCEQRAACAAERAAVARDLLLRAPIEARVETRAARPHVAPPTRRIETGGLPPPRAPTGARAPGAIGTRR